EDDERDLPVEPVDERAGERREQELSERAGGRAGTERERPPALRHELAQRADHQVERAAGETETDQDAGGQMQHAGRGGVGHEYEADRIDDGTRPQHPDGAEAIRHPAGKRLTDAPQQVLDGDSEREYVATPVPRHRQRREELADRRARPEAQQGNEAAAADHETGRAPAAPGLQGHGHQCFPETGWRVPPMARWRKHRCSGGVAQIKVADPNDFRRAWPTGSPQKWRRATPVGGEDDTKRSNVMRSAQSSPAADA